MSDQDKRRADERTHPSPPGTAPQTITGAKPLEPVISRPHERTIRGVAATMASSAALPVAHPGAAPAPPRPTSAIAGGTPRHGTTAAVAPPQASKS